MASYVRAYGKKFFSWLLTFNCLLSIFLAIGLLTGFYAAHWKLYQPYLNSNLLWATVLTSIMNFFPIASLGHVKVRRLKFHHFVYGIAIFAASITFIVFMSFSLLFSLFILNIRNVNLNVGRVFMLVGLTLIIDDFADISNVTMKGLRFVKSKTYQKRRIIHAIQFLLCCVTFFVFVCIAVWLIKDPRGMNLTNLALDGSLLVTSLTAFGSVQKKVWLKITLHPVERDKQRAPRLSG